jgi:hypothetical protein
MQYIEVIFLKYYFIRVTELFQGGWVERRGMTNFIGK